MDERLTQLEAEAQRLLTELASLRQHYVAAQELDALRQENQVMRQAILRYSIACGTVDLQVALIRARHERTSEAMEELKRATAEEEASSRALRHLAQSLQMAEQERSQPD